MLKTCKFWLVVSLCVNLLLLGFFVGGITQHHKGRPGVGAPQNEIIALMHAMPEEERRRIFEDFTKRQADRPVGGGLPLLADIIDAEPFEPAALEQFFLENRSRNDARVLSAQKELLENLSAMSDEERDEMAEKLRHMPRKFDRSRRKNN